MWSPLKWMRLDYTCYITYVVVPVLPPRWYSSIQKYVFHDRTKRKRGWQKVICWAAVTCQWLLSEIMFDSQKRSRPLEWESSYCPLLTCQSVALITLICTNMHSAGSPRIVTFRAGHLATWLPHTDPCPDLHLPIGFLSSFFFVFLSHNYHLEMCLGIFTVIFPINMWAFVLILAVL